MISEAELNAFIQTATPETLIVTVRAQVARIAELEAERDALYGYAALVDELRMENATLRNEIEMLKGNPEAVHLGALAAISALHQMMAKEKEFAAIKAERDALRERLANQERE